MLNIFCVECEGTAVDKLKTLCELSGVSGREEAVRDYIIEQIKDKAEVTVDQMGNVIAFVKGKKRAVKKVMADAHMDEVGFYITYITDDGLLKFSPIGMNVSVFLGRRVKIGSVLGVIGIKPVHMLKDDAKEKMPDADSLYIDIGVSSREEAQKLVSMGDCAVFDEGYEVLGDLVVSKALDDRVGCWALIDIINSEPEYDFYATFSVKEEVGFGARTAAYTIDPEFAVVLESTTAADIAGVEGEKRVCKVSGGAAISFMDNGTLYEKKLLDQVVALAKEKSIPCQLKSAVAGANNAAGIHKSRCGVRTVAMSVPCRYIHSAASVASADDVKAVRNLAEATINKMASGEIE